jgi:hypothetical protein
VNVKLWMNEWMNNTKLYDGQFSITNLRWRWTRLILTMLRNVQLQRIQIMECDVSMISADKHVRIWKETVVVHLKLLFQH